MFFVELILLPRRCPLYPEQDRWVGSIVYPFMHLHGSKRLFRGNCSTPWNGNNGLNGDAKRVRNTHHLPASSCYLK